MCEAWFSPNMAGVDSAGLGEVLQSILSRFPDSEKGRLAKVQTIAYHKSGPLANVSYRTCSSQEGHLSCLA